MQVHNLKKNKGNRGPIRVGRGGKRGKTSGKGTKGQNARSGRKKRPEMRDIIKKLPKLRGRGKNSLKTRNPEFAAINLSVLEASFSKGDTINLNSLLEKKVITKFSGKFPKVKILGSGELTKSLNIEGLQISESAKKIVESLGGKVVV